MMCFGSKTNARKDGLKIRVMELATGPSLFRDVFALNGDPRRQTPFARGASTRFRTYFTDFAHANGVWRRKSPFIVMGSAVEL